MFDWIRNLWPRSAKVGSRVRIWVAKPREFSARYPRPLTGSVILIHGSTKIIVVLDTPCRYGIDIRSVVCSPRHRGDSFWRMRGKIHSNMIGLSNSAGYLPDDSSGSARNRMLLIGTIKLL